MAVIFYRDGAAIAGLWGVDLPQIIYLQKVAKLHGFSGIEGVSVPTLLTQKF
jgi:hypothetical protein